MNWFNPSSEVKTREELFGWNSPNSFLDGLIKTIVQGRNNVQILGERRSGKSSILNCINHELNSDIINNKQIPVIVNFNSYMNYINSDNGYNLFSACILHKMNQVEELKFNGTKKIASVTLNRANDVEGYLSNLSFLSKRKTKSFFRNLIYHIAEIGYSILLLIDEYEAMFMGTFKGNKGSLYGVRDLITKEELPNNIIFQCCITGTRRWSDYYNELGSNDFNFLDETFFIPILNYKEGFELANYGFKRSGKKISQNELKRVYELSGGLPYLIKSICNSYILNDGLNEDYIYNKLYSNFDTIWQRLSREQKLVLGGNNSQKTYVDYLEKLNLIKQGRRFVFNTKMEPNGVLWSKFVSERTNEIDLEKTQKEQQNLKQFLEIREIGNITRSTIIDIVANLHGKGFDPIFNFTSSNAYFDYSGRLSGSPCDKLDSFKEFIVAPYHIIFESTQRFILKPRKQNDDHFEQLMLAIDDIKKYDPKIPVSKHPDENYFITSYRKNLIENFTKKLENNYNLKITITTYPQNMASIPSEFNRYPDEDLCPDIFHIVDVLRHSKIEAHDHQSDKFEVRRFTPEESQEKYLGHKNTPIGMEWFKLQIGILNDLNSVLLKIKLWASEQV